MHCLFLGVLRRHCRVIWGMDLKFDDSDGLDIEASGKSDQGVTERDLVNARQVLRNGSDAAVHKLCHCVMLRLCNDLNCSLRKKETKKFLASELLAYVSTVVGIAPLF